jgi:hypothetical protein
LHGFISKHWGEEKHRYVHIWHWELLDCVTTREKTERWPINAPLLSGRKYINYGRLSEILSTTEK